MNDSHSTGMTLLSATLFGLSALLFAISIGHEAAHETASKHRFVNRILQFIAFGPLGADAKLWRLRHVRSHHVSPNVSGYDVDVGENGVVRLSPDQKLHWYNRYQHLYAPCVFWLVDLHSIFYQDFVYVLRGKMANVSFANRDPMLLMTFAAQKLALVSILFIVPYMAMERPWWHIILGALIVTFVNSTVFVFLLIGTHHCEEVAYPEADATGVKHGWAHHQLLTSMDWSPLNRFANFVAGGANAHAAHHLFPNISHVHYIEITRIIQREAPKFSMPYHESSLVRMIASHLRHLKNLGQAATA
jgi:linoleoyl-CoA desaturase